MRLSLPACQQRQSHILAYPVTTLNSRAFARLASTQNRREAANHARSDRHARGLQQFLLLLRDTKTSRAEGHAHGSGGESGVARGRGGGKERAGEAIRREDCGYRLHGAAEVPRIVFVPPGHDYCRRFSHTALRLNQQMLWSSLFVLARKAPAGSSRELDADRVKKIPTESLG